LETEGLVLDTDYTARAFPTALQELAADGLPVVFWHTGGLVGAISDYATAAIDLDAAAAAGAQMLGGGS
jgi:1-aminocyclopropane-1-carboxylate deaminase/D-cysteine desulfhydrase-like pyridoxal-dependent ACC family enzyme